MIAAIRPDGMPIAGPTHVAPSPDTVLEPRQRHIHAQDQEQAHAALKLDEQTAEVARLTQALHDAKQVHAAEIERLRAQHAFDMQRLVEALWQAQDAARAVSAPPERAAKAQVLESPPSSRHQPTRVRVWLARFAVRYDRSLLGRAGTSLGRIVRRWATVFRAWS